MTIHFKNKTDNLEVPNYLEKKKSSTSYELIFSTIKHDQWYL